MNEIIRKTVTGGTFNTLLSTMDRYSSQKTNKEIMVLYNTIDQMDLIDIYRTFHPNETKYAFFSNTYGSFSKIKCMVVGKTSLNKFKRPEIISCIFLDHNVLK